MFDFFNKPENQKYKIEFLSGDGTINYISMTPSEMAQKIAALNKEKKLLQKQLSESENRSFDLILKLRRSKNEIAKTAIESGNFTESIVKYIDDFMKLD